MTVWKSSSKILRKRLFIVLIQDTPVHKQPSDKPLQITTYKVYPIHVPIDPEFERKKKTMLCLDLNVKTRKATGQSTNHPSDSQGLWQEGLRFSWIFIALFIPKWGWQKILCFNSIPPETILFDHYKIYMLRGAFGTLGVIFTRIRAKMFCSFHFKSYKRKCCKR